MVRLRFLKTFNIYQDSLLIKLLSPYENETGLFHSYSCLLSFHTQVENSKLSHSFYKINAVFVQTLEKPERHWENEFIALNLSKWNKVVNGIKQKESTLSSDLEIIGKITMTLD